MFKESYLTLFCLKVIPKWFIPKFISMKLLARFFSSGSEGPTCTKDSILDGGKDFANSIINFFSFSEKV